MELLSIEAVGHEHIGTDPDSDFVIAFPIKAQAVRFGFRELGPVDLDRGRAGREFPVALQIEASEQAKLGVIAEKDSLTSLGDGER